MAAPAAAGDLTVVLEGTVSALNPAPTSGVFAGVATGDAARLELCLQYPPTFGTTPAAADSASYRLVQNASSMTVGMATDTFDVTTPSSAYIRDSYLSTRDELSLFNRPLAGGGLVRFTLIDSSDTAFDTADLALLRGVFPETTWSTTSFGLQVGGGFIELSVADLTIGTLGIGDVICAPAVPNSTGFAALQSAEGTTQLNPASVRLVARRLPQQSFGFFLVSNTQATVVAPGGSQGNLCLGGSIGRYQAQALNSGTAGSFELQIDPLALAQPTGNVAAQVGETWTFQAWYRDANPSPTSNFTDAIAITFE